MWSYYNPSNIIFKTGALDDLSLSNIIEKKKYCIFTYPDSIFKKHIKKITDALGDPLLIVDNIEPNPDYKNLKIISKVNLHEHSAKNNFDIKSILPDLSKNILLKNHLINIIYEKDKFDISGKGSALFQKEESNIDYPSLHLQAAFKGQLRK